MAFPSPVSPFAMLELETTALDEMAWDELQEMTDTEELDKVKELDDSETREELTKLLLASKELEMAALEELTSLEYEMESPTILELEVPALNEEDITGST